jgi:hypothetical protein
VQGNGIAVFICVHGIISAEFFYVAFLSEGAAFYDTVPRGIWNTTAVFIPRYAKTFYGVCEQKKTKKETPWPLVRERTIPTERPPLFDEI